MMPESLGHLSDERSVSVASIARDCLVQGNLGSAARIVESDSKTVRITFVMIYP